MLSNFNCKKSSFHFINGNFGIKRNIIQNILYLLSFIIEFFQEKKNYINNTIDIDFDFKNFYHFLNIDNFETLLKKKTAVRIAIDYILYNYLKKFPKDQKITILDIGCGNGQYYDFLSNIFPKLEYVGLDSGKDIQDIKSNKKIYKFEFGKDEVEKLESIKNNHGNFDLILSITALEHFQNDKESLEIVSSIFNPKFQIHFLPATMSFFNFIIHGFRRYNYHSINKLIQNINYQSKIISLGNQNSRNYHYHFFQNAFKKKHPFNFLKKKLPKNFVHDPLTFFQNIIYTGLKDYPSIYVIELTKKV